MKSQGRLTKAEQSAKARACDGASSRLMRRVAASMPP